CTDGQEVRRQPGPTTPEIRRVGAFRVPIPGLRSYAPSLSPWLNVSLPQPLQQASGSSPSHLHGAQRWTRAPLLTRPQNPSGHAYPKTLPALQENRCGASLESSSVFPLVEPPLFLPRHGTCSDWEAFAVRKLDDDTEKIAASRCLAEDIIHRVRPCRLGALHQRPTKAHFFDLCRAYSVLGNVRNPVF